MFKTHERQTLKNVALKNKKKYTIYGKYGRIDE